MADASPMGANAPAVHREGERGLRRKWRTCDPRDSWTPPRTAEDHLPAPKEAGARVLPVVTRREAGGYVTVIGAPWENFPSGDDAADAARMNAEIERAIVAGDAAQYLWSHKRFKTRPPGEKAVY